MAYYRPLEIKRGGYHYTCTNGAENMIVVTRSSFNEIVHKKYWFFHYWSPPLTKDGSVMTPRSYIKFDHEIVSSVHCIRVLGIEFSFIKAKQMQEILRKYYPDSKGIAELRAVHISLNKKARQERMSKFEREYPW